MSETCPDCDLELERGHDSRGYEVLECPGCGKWKRPGWVALREAPDE